MVIEFVICCIDIQKPYDFSTKCRCTFFHFMVVVHHSFLLHPNFTTYIIPWQTYVSVQLGVFTSFTFSTMRQFFASKYHLRFPNKCYYICCLPIVCCCIKIIENSLRWWLIISKSETLSLLCVVGKNHQILSELLKHSYFWKHCYVDLSAGGSYHCYGGRWLKNMTKTLLSDLSSM